MTTHDEIAELLGAYALDAVEPDEAVIVAAHLAECPRCTAELAEHLEVAGMLGDMGGDAPKELWASIATQAVRPAGAPASSDDVLTRVPIGLGVPRRAPRRRRSAMRAAGGVLLAAAAAVAIVLMAVQITSLDAKVGTLNAIREQRGITAAAETALLNPNAERIQLNTNAGRGPMAAELVVVPSGTSFLLDSSMRTLPSSKTYQLWATTDGRQISLGLLGADPVTVPFLASAPTASTVYAVTVEPKGGSVTPTQAPVAVSV